MRDLLMEYCHSSFGTDKQDSATVADVILTKFKHSKRGPFNATLRIEHPEQVLATLEGIEKRMPAWAKDGWRYGVFKARVQLENLDEKSRAQQNWPKKLDAILSRAVTEGDDAALAGALVKAKTYLGEVKARLQQLEGECDRLTRHLYVDLYGTPNRHAAHGPFRLQFPHGNLVAPLMKQCDALAKEKNAAKRKQGVKALLKKTDPHSH